MKEMKTLDLFGTVYEIVDDKARTDVYTKCAPAIVQTGNGKIITIRNSSDHLLRNLRVFGRTEQVVTTGKNLLENTATTTTVNGITYTVNDDGSVLLNGTSSDVSTLVVNSAFVFEAGVSYTMTGCPAGGGTDTYRLDNTDRIADDGAGGTVTYDSETSKPIRIRIASGVTVNNMLFRPMIRLSTVTDATYEPYTGGVASPNPECVQNLNNLTNPTVSLCSSNMFGGIDLANKIYSVSKATTSVKDETAKTVTYSGGGINTAILFENDFKKNQQYTLILYGRNTTATAAYINLTFLYDDNTTMAGTHKFETHGSDSYAVVTSEAGKTVKALIGRWASGEVTLYYEMCGLFEGVKTPDDFEPYIADNTISVPYTIPGIPVDASGNYTDENGQQWICDEVDFSRGVYVHRVGVTDLTDAEWSVDNNGQFFTTLDSGKYLAGNTVLCTHLAGGSEIYINAVNTIRVNKTIGDGTAETMKTALAGCLLMAPLANPYQTPLTDEDIENFKMVSTNYPNTTVLNDQSAEVEVEYIADTMLFMQECMPPVSEEQIQAAVSAWLETNISNADDVSF